MPSVQDVRNVILASLANLLQRFSDIEKAMYYINSTEEIRRNSFVVRCVISIRDVTHIFILKTYFDLDFINL